MYIGGTDEKALHHLFAEVIDNSMDEAVAGHATFIEVALDADGYLSVTDNGRGIPGRSASQIQGQVRARSHHDDAARRRQIRFSKVYETSGGLHGVGVSVVNALSDDLVVEVARNRGSTASVFARPPLKAASRPRRSPEPPRHQVRFHPDAEDFRQQRGSSRPGSTRWPAPRPTCSAASRSAGTAPGTDRRKGRNAAEGGVPLSPAD
jgi:topoisomerase-4 subunit B